jgi:hypothetical protein
MGTTRVFGKLGTAATIKTITAATTLTDSDSGKVIILNAAAGKVVTLPSVAVAGFNVKIIVGAAFATTNFTVVALTNKIQGGVIVNSTYVPAVDENTISFVASAETVGDFAELVSDGTNWLLTGVGALAGSITVTAP